MTAQRFDGTTAAAAMTPEARRLRASRAAMARHYAWLVPLMVAALRTLPGSAVTIDRQDRRWAAYPTLRDLSERAWQWVFTEARRAMGF